MVKKVVYFLGAGASQAERDHSGKTKESKDILIEICTAKVIENIKANKPAYNDIINRYKPTGIRNIEQFISLLESTNIQTNYKLADECREGFVRYLIENTKDVEPILIMALLQLHEVNNEEELAGIITTNYDSLIDRACKNLNRNVSYGFNSLMPKANSNANAQEVTVIKLHGSFNWKGIPIDLMNDTESLNNISELVWTPPSVQKDPTPYPSNMLWGRAFELLNCDILRIVGSSLSPTDWGVLSLLFRTQLITKENGYDIELINYPDTCDQIKNTYKFLNNIKDLRELVYFDSENSSYANNPKFNPFLYWIQDKARLLKKNGKNLDTYTYLYNVLTEGKT